MAKTEKRKTQSRLLVIWKHVLLSLHHRHNQHMLTAFTVLQSGAVPKDRSYIGNYTQDS